MTQNNHESMKTIVETFIVEETEALIYDNEKLDRWNELVAELKLTGQGTLLKEGKSPIPFMVINTATKSIIETLCPAASEISEYNRTPIPVEILDLVALSRKEGYFNEIIVRFDERTPDPFVIGRVGRYEPVSWSTKPYFYVATEYLIGKWGDVKRSFDELKEMAIKRYTAERKVQLREELKRTQRQIEDIDSEVADKFGAGRISGDALDF